VVMIDEGAITCRFDGTSMGCGWSVVRNNSV
jgi:hypothetical protein